MTKDKRTYDVLIDVWNKAEPYFKFVLPRVVKSLPATRDPWRVAPDDKKQKVHVLAGSRESEIAVFPNAIAIGSPATGGMAEGAKQALVLGTPLSILFIIGGVSLMSPSGVGILLGLFCISFGALMALLIVWLTRGWLYSPADWPVVFNRKDRSVIWAPVVRFPFWKFWVTKLTPQWRTASWDDVRARSYKYMQSNAGMSFHDSYSLFLLWGGAEGDPRSLDQAVSIGYQGYFEDELLWMLYEHIRRYMEEDGPAIPHGETLRPLGKGRPIVYPLDVIEACGGPPLSMQEVEKIAAAAPMD